MRTILLTLSLMLSGNAFSCHNERLLRIAPVYLDDEHFRQIEIINENFVNGFFRAQGKDTELESKQNEKGFSKEDAKLLALSKRMTKK